MGRWNPLEPPLVLEESPTPAGGGVDYVGVFPLADLPDTTKQTLERLQFDFKVRISSDVSSTDHEVRVSLWGEPLDL
jgi:hypothetical protein